MSYRIRLAHPRIEMPDKVAIMEVLDTPNLSNGPKVREFEDAMADYIGVSYAVAVVNGTAGLHLSLLALGVGPGDEVITTPFTFISTANAISYTGATPVFVDIDPETLNIDPGKIEAAVTWKTKAILPVHVFGKPCYMHPILDIAIKHELAVVEDACEAIGAKVHNMRVGAIGHAGVFAFYPNKQITSGEGGMITTDNMDIAMKCRMLRIHGRDPTSSLPWYTERGYNYKMSDIHAALGRSQLRRIDRILEHRREIAEMYSDRLREHVRVLDPNRSWFSYMVILPEKYNRKDLKSVVRRLANRGIETSSYFPPIHLQDCYGGTMNIGQFPVTESIARRILALPFHTYLSEDDIEQVCANLLEVCL